MNHKGALRPTIHNYPSKLPSLQLALGFNETSFNFARRDRPTAEELSFFLRTDVPGLLRPRSHMELKKTDLLDTRARRIFETTALACAVDAYPYHMPLQAKAGPCVTADGQQMLMMSSYDYLGLIGDPRIDKAAIDAVKRYGTSTSGARLLTGTLDIHGEMEGRSRSLQRNRRRSDLQLRLYGESWRHLWPLRPVGPRHHR